MGWNQIRNVQKTDADNPSVRVLGPGRDWITMGLRELVEYHELLYFLVWRDIKVRYKQSVLGAAWAILQPFMMMVVEESRTAAGVTGST